MELKNVAIVVVITAVLSAVITKYYFPKLQMQTVEVEKEVIKNNIVTVTKVVKDKDGNETTETTVVDKSTTKNTDSKVVSIAASKDWMISASAQTDFKEGLKPVYGLQVQRRILGPFYLGATANTDRAIGVSVGFEF